MQGRVCEAEVPQRQVLRLNATMPLFEALDLFQAGKSRLGGVIDGNGKLVGIVTLEDIIEELLQEEIIDDDGIGDERYG